MLLEIPLKIQCWIEDFLEVLPSRFLRFANTSWITLDWALDAIIEPARTRAKLISALRSLEGKRATNPRKKHGNIPL